MILPSGRTAVLALAFALAPPALASWSSLLPRRTVVGAFCASNYHPIRRGPRRRRRPTSSDAAFSATGGEQSFFLRHRQRRMVPTDEGTASTPTSSSADAASDPTATEASVSPRRKKAAVILSLSDPNDANNDPLHVGSLPDGARVVAVGRSWDDFVAARGGDRVDDDLLLQANAVFVSHPKAREPLADLIRRLPHLEWIHTRSAGIDFVASPSLASFKGTVTNAKGQFSSTLAEYAMLAMLYFAKDVVRLRRQQRARVWDKFDVRELRGASLGVVGYGDIGRAAASLAVAAGMNVVGWRKKRPGPRPDEADPPASRVYGSDDPDNLLRVFRESDYVLCALPLTHETRHVIGKAQFDAAKSGLVFINVGRGPVVDEPEMVRALQDGRLRGAALDVLEQEPLPESSPLWELDNVLLSPHNMDQTPTFMRDSTAFYVRELLPRFLHGEVPLPNVVDPKAGY